MAGQFREERLVEEQKGRPRDDEPEMPLKNGGGRMSVIETRILEGVLRGFLEKDPEHFRALWALVDGRKAEVSKQQIRDLRRDLLLGRDLNPLPDVQAVMTAAVRDTPDGLCLVDPIDVRSAEDAAIVRHWDEELERRRQKGAGQLWRKIFRDDKGNDRGRSP
jgi:hypothetical protein